MKGTWQGSGTWQTGGGGGGGLVVVVLVLLALGSGAPAAVASVLATVVAVVAIGAGVIAVVMAAAGLGYLAWRRRHDGRQRRQVVPRPQYHQLSAQEPERPALEARAPAALDQSGPRELHQHWHFHGVDAEQVAEILRRQQESDA